MRILLDLDEVLCDFVGAACRVHGLPAGFDPRSNGEYSLEQQWGITSEQFWGPINAKGVEFWEGLEPKPWNDSLLKLVQDFTDDWAIVSNPMNSPYAAQGKLMWLQKHLGTQADRYCLTPHKYLLANPNSILIDDCEANIQAFNTAGGRAILFPSQGNSLYSICKDPIPCVQKWLRFLSHVYTPNSRRL